MNPWNRIDQVYVKSFVNPRTPCHPGRAILPVFCALPLLPANACARAADTAEDESASAAPSAPAEPLETDKVDSLVAPIALYPDELVSQVLVASTYPLEIVQAHQWLEQHSDLKGQELTEAVQKENWDPSVQALV